MEVDFLIFEIVDAVNFGECAGDRERKVMEVRDRVANFDVAGEIGNDVFQIRIGDGLAGLCAS